MDKLFSKEVEEMLYDWCDMVCEHVERLEDTMDDTDFNSTLWWRHKEYIEGMNMCMSMFETCAKRACTKMMGVNKKE